MFLCIIMVEAYLHRIDTALAEAFAKHLAPLIQTNSPRSSYIDPTEWILSCLDESLTQVDIAETQETFRIVNEFPILPGYLFTLTWLKSQFKDPNWRDLVASRILSIQRSTIPSCAL